MAYFGTYQANPYSSLLGQTVRVNRGGPDSVEGRLIAVHSDYLVVVTKDGTVYIPTRHVKSVTVHVGRSGGKSGGQSGGKSGGRSGGRSAGSMGGMMGGNTASPWSTMGPQTMQPQTFAALLQQLKHQPVQVNRGGPEKVEGILADVTHDTLVIVVKKELVRIAIVHVKSITVSGRSRGKSGGGSGGKKSGGGSGGKKSGGTGGQRTGAAGARTGGGTKGQRTGATGGTKGQRTGGARGRTGGRTGGKQTGGTGGRTGGSRVLPGTLARHYGTVRQRQGAWDPFPAN